jgi:hypothetical protein
MDPEKAAAWLLANHDQDHYDSAVEGLTQGLASKDPESALEWASVITDTVIKMRVVSAAGYEQFHHDSAMAEERLADSGLPPSSIAAIRENWAVRWHGQIRRTSMNVSSVASAAIAAGAEYDRASAKVLIQQISEGIVIEGGPFDGQFFGVPILTAQEQGALEEWPSLNEEGLLSFSALDASE